MGQVKSLATQAAERGVIARRIFDDASADGHIDPHEMGLIGDALNDLCTTVVGARDALHTGLAFIRGVSDVAYQDGLVRRYRESRDEVPPLEAA